MRKLLPVFAILVLFALPVMASSQQAYQDYLYQYDTYRQISKDFQTAKNEYQKFQSLSSQTTALDKTKQFLTQRDNLFKSYLLLLSEKLDENTGVTSADKSLYQQLLASESAVLAAHALQIPGASSLDAAITLSPPFESHYLTLQRVVRKVLISLALGQLSTLNTSYQAVVTTAQSVVGANSMIFPPQKQATIDQWMDQIQRKELSFQQKYTSLAAATAALDGYDVNELDQKYNTILKGITDARQYLIDGASYLGELKQTLKYIE